MLTGLIFNIQRYCVHDGPGIRTTLFLKGCPLDCWWCHNPESKSPRPEISLNEGRCIRCGQCEQACPQDLAGPCQRCGACAEACPTGARQIVGRPMTVGEALAEIVRDRIFHEESGGGATLSGGEPLMQPDFVCALLEACRAQGIHTALDTCGHANQAHLLRAACLADLVLYDLKVIDEEKHRRATGVSSALILDNLRALASVHVNIWLRIPVVPGVNDADEELDALAQVSKDLPGVGRVCLLPYHATGAGKLARLADPRQHIVAEPPSAARMRQIADRFRARGLDAHVGG